MKKILVIEDELPYLRLLQDQLLAQGYQVVKANNGLIGLDAAKKEKPDMILLDMRMPVMDGATMLKKLRADTWGKNAKVIILSNLNDSETISEGMNEKVSRYIVKSDSALKSVLEDIKRFIEQN